MTLINLHSIGQALLDLAYPPSCLACRRGLSATGALCSPCWSQVRFIERPFCERLGTPFSHDLGIGILSPEAISDPPVYQRARAVAYYEEGPIASLVHRLKYADHTELAGPMDGESRRGAIERSRCFDSHSSASNAFVPTTI